MSLTQETEKEERGGEPGIEAYSEASAVKALAPEQSQTQLGISTPEISIYSRRREHSSVTSVSTTG